MTVTTAITLTAPTILDLTAFRKWVTGLRDGLLAAGLVQTTDTGQMDPATAPLPVTTNAASGYMMFRFNDAAQTTHPVFLKVEIGRAGAGDTPNFWLTIGKVTDGAGAITGSLLMARSALHGTSSGGTAIEYQSFFSGDGSGVCLMGWAGTSQIPSHFFYMERRRGSSGAVFGDGLAMIFKSNGTAVIRYMGYDGVIAAAKCAESSKIISIPGSTNGTNPGVGLSKDGITAPIFPITWLAPGVQWFTSSLLVALHPGDTSVLQAAVINGSSRTFRAWSGTVASASASVDIAGSGNNILIWPAIGWA